MRIASTRCIRRVVPTRSKVHARCMLESRVREVVFDYRKHRNQYLRCKLQTGRVVVGTVSRAGANYFFRQTGLAARQRIS